MKEKCRQCERVFVEIKEAHPDWSVEDRFKCAEEALRNVRPQLKCEYKICIPLDQAVRVLNGLSSQHTEIPKVQEPDPPYMTTARRVVEDKIDDEVSGHPDKWTAYSHQKNCGCPDSRREWEDWKKLKKGE